MNDTTSSNSPDDQPTEEATIENRRRAMLKSHVAQLSEHFDSVHIFVTKKESGDQGGATVGSSEGDGNWYARFGQVREWLIKEDEQMRIEKRQQNE